MAESSRITGQSRLFVDAQDFASSILDYINTKPKPVAESLRITGQSRLFVEAQDFASPILDYINTKPKPVAESLRFTLQSRRSQWLRFPHPMDI